jgi:hypothetical protein
MASGIGRGNVVIEAKSTTGMGKRAAAGQYKWNRATGIVRTVRLVRSHSSNVEYRFRHLLCAALKALCTIHILPEPQVRTQQNSPRAHRWSSGLHHFARHLIPVSQLHHREELLAPNYLRPAWNYGTIASTVQPARMAFSAVEVRVLARWTT